MELNLNNQWVTMTATSNNQYAYYNTLGPWNTYFPLHIRVTSVTGETVDDYIPSKTGGVGSAQFTDVSALLAPSRAAAITPAARAFPSLPIPVLCSLRQGRCRLAVCSAHPDAHVPHYLPMQRPWLHLVQNLDSPQSPDSRLCAVQTGIYPGITSAATDLAALPAGLASSFFAPGTTSTPAAPQATSPAASTPASPSPSPSQSPSPVAASPSPAVNTTSPTPSGNTFPIINYGQCGGAALVLVDMLDHCVMLGMVCMHGLFPVRRAVIFHMHLQSHAASEQALDRSSFTAVHMLLHPRGSTCTGYLLAISGPGRSRQACTGA